MTQWLGELWVNELGAWTRLKGTALFDEVHDLPDTATAKGCWVGIIHRDDYISCAVFSTSKATGWDLPLEWQFISHAPPLSLVTPGLDPGVHAAPQGGLPGQARQ